MKVMLITGATGTVGGHLVGRFHGRYRILAQGRDAEGLAALQARHPGVETVCGDLQSPQLAEAVGKSQLVIHAAGQRYADIGETHCALTLDANIGGTQRLADLATRAAVERFVFVSTVEADRPTSVHAMSKFLAERLVLELAEQGYDARFHVCRLARIAAPHRRDGAYTVEDAGDLIEYALLHGGNGDILGPEMPAVTGAIETGRSIRAAA